MLHTAYLLICMVSPVGGEYCTPAAQPIQFDNVNQCMRYLEDEVKFLKEDAPLEVFRPHLPSMVEGKLRLKWACSTATQTDWLGRDLPKVKGALEDEVPRQD